MPAVQGPVGAVNGQVEAVTSAYTVNQLPAAALVDGSVTEQPQVGSQPVLVFFQHGAQVGRAGFFLTIHENFQVDRQGNTSLIKGHQRAVQCNDRRLVVAGRAAEDAPFRVKRRCHRYQFTPVFDHVSTHDRHPRVRGPARRVNRLSIVVDIEQDCGLRAGHHSFGINRGIAAFEFQ